MPDPSDQAILELLGPPSDPQERAIWDLLRGVEEPAAATEPEPKILVPAAEEREVGPTRVRTETGDWVEVPGSAGREKFVTPPGGIPILREEVNPDWVDQNLRRALEVQRAGGAPDPLLPDWVDYTIKKTPLVGTWIEADQMLNAMDSARKIQSGKANPLDFARVADLIVQEEKRVAGGWPRKVLDLVAELPKFGAEFAMTGPAFTAGQSATRYALTKFLGKRIRDESVKALSAIPGAALQTMANPQLIARNVAYNLADNLNLSQDDRGRVQVIVRNDEDDIRQAITKAMMQSGVEIGSERMGFLLDKPLAGIRGAVINRWLKPGAKAGRTVARLAQILKTSGYNGVVSEIFEERVAEAAAPAWGKPWELPSWQDLAAEAVAFSLPGAGLAAARRLGTRLEKPSDRENEFILRMLAEAAVNPDAFKLAEEGPPGVELAHEDAEGNARGLSGAVSVRSELARRFLRGITAAAQEHPFGAAVDIRPLEFYEDPANQIFLSADDGAGAVVTAEKDLVSVFRRPSSPSRSSEILLQAAPLSRTLDAYDIDGFLPTLYGRFGFRPVSRIKWDPAQAPPNWPAQAGTPDVVFMIRDVNGLSGAPQITEHGYEDVREDVPVFATYDEAKRAQLQAAAKVIPPEESAAPRGGKLKPEFRETLGPELARFLERNLPAERVESLRADTIQKLATLAASFPSLEELVRLARLGETGRRWYQLARGVIEAMAGADAWRVVGLLAATSPNKGVPDSIRPAMDALKIWNQAGRPTDPQRIRALLYRATKGDVSKPIYLGSDIGNAVAVLSSSNWEEAYSKMSDTSPKVRPFFRAIMGDLEAVVNDTIMARIFGVDPNDIGNVVQNSLATAMTTAVARRLGWAPAEAQAAMWVAGRLIGTRIRYAANRKSGFPRLANILAQDITPEDLMPKDDLASLLVFGQTTGEGFHHDYPKYAKEAGLNVELGRAAYARLERSLISPGARTNAARALGARRALSFGRRLEAGYTGGQLRLREEVDDPEKIIQIGQAVAAEPSPAEAAQLELALGNEILRRVGNPTRARNPGGDATLQGPQLRLFARSVAADFVAHNGITILGQDVSDPHKAAILFQVLRDPRFETFRWWFTKGGKLVGTYAASARLPGTTYPWASKDTPGTLGKLARQLGADGFYLSHNHPSGNPYPSQADVHVTKKLAIASVGGARFQGHIVIDHGRYAVIGAQGQVGTWELQRQGDQIKSVPAAITGEMTFDPRWDPLLAPQGVLGRYLGTWLGTPDLLAPFAAQLQRERPVNGLGFIFTDSRYGARGFGEMSVADFLAPGSDQVLRETARGLGARFALAYYSSPTGELSLEQRELEHQMGKAMQRAMAKNLVFEFLWDGTAFTEAFGRPPGDYWMGVRETSDMALRIAEETKPRKFGQQVAADPRLSAPLRQAGEAQRYTPIPNVVTVEDAEKLIISLGPDKAWETMRDPAAGIPDRVKVVMGEVLMRQADQMFQKTNDTAYLDRSVAICRYLSEEGTRLGQGVQAFATFRFLGPEGTVHLYRTEVDRLRNARAAKKGFLPGMKIPDWLEKELPKFDPEFARELLVRAKAAYAKPRGFQREEALLDIRTDIARRLGVKRGDVAVALWYSNILSGWATQVRNTIGNLSNLMAEAAAHLVVNPAATPQVLAGLYQGFGRGILDFGHVLWSGKVTGTRLAKVEQPRVLETVKFKGPFYPFNAWKYVFRFMAATDMAFFRTAEEMQAQFLARSLARSQGLRGAALTTEMGNILHNTKAARKAAEAQAKAEGLAGATARRRVWEIMEQSRPEALVQQAAAYGRYTTYNQDPDGWLGVFARLVAQGSQQVPPLRLLVPFTHVVANVTNASLNWTPWGFTRLFNWAQVNNELAPTYGTPEWKLQAARAGLGSLGMMAVAALALANSDDDDPPFMLTADGPTDPERRRQLRESGWRPYSVKIGDNYFSYQATSLHMGFALVGNLMDAKRYRKLDEADVLNRIYYALQQTGRTVLDQSFLVGLSDFFGAMARTAVPSGPVQFSGLARTASSMVVPGLVKQLYQLFDPSVYDASTVRGALLRDVPIACQSGRPMLNALGEPVKRDLNPFFGKATSDQLWLALGQRGLHIPTSEPTTMILDRVMTPDEYYQYIETAGPIIRARLEPRIPLLQTLDQREAQKWINSQTREIRARVKRQLFGSE